MCMCMCIHSQQTSTHTHTHTHSTTTISHSHSHSHSYYVCSPTRLRSLCHSPIHPISVGGCRSVDAQLQAIRGLGEHPTSSASGILASVLANRNIFYRVRMVPLLSLNECERECECESVRVWKCVWKCMYNVCTM
jgi:hypothetical protein